jgi:hypothetical protein
VGRAGSILADIERRPMFIAMTELLSKYSHRHLMAGIMRGSRRKNRAKRWEYP